MIKLPALTSRRPQLNSGGSNNNKIGSKSMKPSAAASRTSAAAVVPVPSIRLVGRLAPHVFLGQLWHPRRPTTRSVVVKNAGTLVRGRDGKLRGPWKEWQAAKRLMLHGVRDQASASGSTSGHRNVVQVLDVHLQSNWQVYLVMEHCPGGDLLAHLIRTQPEDRVSERVALDIILQVARGLHYLHTTCGLAHRDVSLENILVARDGAFKIGDLGLSTRADTLAFGCVGKTQYVAPEVVTMTAYDPVKADIWSLGVVLFMLVTGSPLVEFAAPISPEFQAFKAIGCRGMLRARGVELSRLTDDLLTGMLESDPRRRFATMGQILAHPAMAGAATATGEPRYSSSCSESGEGSSESGEGSSGSERSTRNSGSGPSDPVSN